MKRISFSLLIIFSFFQISAQDFVYEPLRSSGKLPKALIVSSTSKYEADVKAMDKNEEGLSAKAQKSFYLETNFRIDALLQSGKVLFNDPIGLYVNEVADEILKDNPKLRKQLQFFVVKSPFPNAFTTNDGIILVNVGLLNRLDTEAQLAFILCHEIAHFQSRHVIKGFALAMSLESARESQAELSDFDKLILKNNYSRENERMADSLGFVLFGKTNYSPETLPPVFDILKVAHEPYLFPNEPFSHVTNPFWTPDFTPPEQKAEEKTPKKSIGGISFISDFDEVGEKENKEEEVNEEVEEKVEEEDALSTHPNPSKRKMLLLQQLIAAGYEGEALFLVSQEKFETCRKLAAYELCRMLLLDAGYFDALYQAVSLLEESPEDPYLNKVVMKALYGIAKYRNKGNSIPDFINYDQLPIHLKHFYTCFSTREFKKDEYLILALGYAAEHLRRFPDQLSTQMYMKDLMIDLFEHIPNFQQINDSTNADYAEYIPAIEKMFTDSVFQDIYESAEKTKQRSDDFEAFRNSDDGSRKLDKLEKKQENRGFNLGIDKVVVFSPFYYRLTIARDGSQMEFILSEAEQKKIPSYIRQSADKLGLSVVLLDGQDNNQTAPTEAFNDMMIANEWYADLLQHGGDKLVPMIYDEMQELVEKYETPYFLNMGSVAMKLPQGRQIGRGFYSLFLGLTPPWAIYMGARRAAKSIVYSVTLDAENNHVLAYQFQNSNDLIKDIRMESYVYYYLWQIKSEGK